MRTPNTRSRSIVRAIMPCLSGWLVSLASAQAPPLPEDSMDLILIPSTQARIQAAWQVTRVEPDGRLTLMATPDAREHLVTLAPTEGYYILQVAEPAGGRATPRLYRALVTDVAPLGVVQVTVGPDAAKALRLGEAAMLSRPLRATTTLMKKLPDEIRVDDADRGIEAGIAAARAAAQRMQATNNLKQIGLAMHSFASAHDFFPPAVVYGPDGKPWHSWRVLLLPYLEQAPMYNQYDFSQPWDAPANRKILENMPEVYRDPAYGDAKDSSTHYAVVTGPTTLFPDGIRMRDPKLGPLGEGRGTRLQDVTDGTVNTILVVPASPDRKIPWTKPEDIFYSGQADFPGLGKPEGIATPYREGARADGAGLAPVLFADGSVRTISEGIGPRVLEALLTRSGGEVVSSDAIPGGSETRPAMKVIRFRLDGDRLVSTIEDVPNPAGNRMPPRFPPR